MINVLERDHQETRRSRRRQNLTEHKRALTQREYENRRAEHVRRIEHTLNLGFVQAQSVYEYFITPELRTALKHNKDHGDYHINRVGLHLVDDLTHSPEIIEKPELVEKYSKGLTLAVRIHDIVEQHLATIGFKDIKIFHPEGSALIVFLLSPELMEMLDYTPEDLYAAAIMCYFHSEPERLAAAEVHLPTFTELQEWLVTQLETTKKQIPKELLSYLPELQSIDINERIAELKQYTPFDYMNLSAVEVEELITVARWFSLADKMDTLLPAALANLRTIRTFTHRQFYKKADQQFVKESLDQAIEHMRRQAELKPSSEMQQKIREKEEYQAYLLHMFEQYGELPLQDEIQFRKEIGHMAPDDFTRIILEVLKDFEKWKPTSYQRAHIANGLLQRLDYLEEAVIEMAEGKHGFVERAIGAEYSEEIKEFVDEVLSQKHVEPQDIPRIRALIKVAKQNVEFLAARVGLLNKDKIAPITKDVDVFARARQVQ